MFTVATTVVMSRFLLHNFPKSEAGVYSSYNAVWLASTELAKECGVVSRTVRMHLVRFLKHGMVERSGAFPPSYRISPDAKAKHPEHFERLSEAGEVFASTGR